jgi:hypothetical protein
MKRLLYVLSMSIFFGLLFHVSACKKLADHILKQPERDLGFCNIERIVSYDHINQEYRTYLFTYNSLGNPVSIKNNNPGSANPNFYFRYDSKNRLTDFIGSYENGLYDTWVKYYDYNASGIAMKATSYTWGEFGASPDPHSFYISENRFLFDKSGRLIKTTSTVLQDGGIPVPPVTTEHRIAYNDDGNVIRHDASYDDQVSLLRTNRVLMFVDGNYSKNNVFEASSYNAWGLPLEFNDPSKYLTILGQVISVSKIDYSCR